MADCNTHDQHTQWTGGKTRRTRKGKRGEVTMQICCACGKETGEKRDTSERVRRKK